MIQKYILCWLVTYCIYLISVFFHELSHKKKAEKFNLEILSKRKDVLKSKESKPSRFSLFIFGIELKPFGGNLHLKDGEIEKLKLNDQKEIFLVGIKSDILFLLSMIFIYFIFAALDFADVTSIITSNVNFIFSASLLFILGKTFDNIFDPFNKGGDLKKLFELKQEKHKKYASTSV